MDASRVSPAILQAALEADGKPAWLQGLIGDEDGANLLQEQTGASSEDEVRVSTRQCGADDGSFMLAGKASSPASCLLC